MNHKCENTTCQNDAQFIKRFLEEPHWYCSTPCADQGLERLKNPSAYEKTVPSTTVGRGEQSRPSSPGESTIGSEETKIENEEVQPQKGDIGMTQKNHEQENDESDTRGLMTTAQKTMPEVLGKDSTSDHGHKSERSIQSYEVAKLESMNMLDDSIKSMHGLIISVRDNIKQKNEKAEYKHVDPAQVNAAANCAREMGNLMKIKVQLMGKK